MASPSPVTPNDGPRVALIHALEESVAPARAAFAAVWPQARPFDLLDTSLAPDRASGGSGPATHRRIGDLFDYALQCGATADPTEAVLFTCSAFPPEIASVQARAKVPVLTPNFAAFREALIFGARVAISVTFEPTAAGLIAEIRDIAQRQDLEVLPRVVAVPEAFVALKAGDAVAHDQHVAEALAGVWDVDSIVLGQFSMARAAAGVQARSKIPVITTPTAAVKALRALHQAKTGAGAS